VRRSVAGFVSHDRTPPTERLGTHRAWNDKAAGFVGYGSAGGVRAVEHLRGIMAQLEIADVRESVALSLMTDFENFRDFRPHARHEQGIERLLDQVVRWANALKTVRVAAANGV